METRLDDDCAKRVCWAWHGESPHGGNSRTLKQSGARVTVAAGRSSTVW